MSLPFLLEAPIALLPTLAFLFLLDQLDSFRLVSLRAAATALAAGGALAGLAYFADAGGMGAPFVRPPR